MAALSKLAGAAGSKAAKSGKGGKGGKKGAAQKAVAARKKIVLLGLITSGPFLVVIAAVLAMGMIIVIMFGGGAQQNGQFSGSYANCTVQGGTGTDGSPSILGSPSVTEAQLEAWWKATGHPNPLPRSSDNPEGSGTETVMSLTDLYWQEGITEGVRPDMAMVQMIEETGSWSNTDSTSGNNPAGINHYDSAASGSYFPTSQIGIRAQIQRLKQIVMGNNVPLANQLAATIGGSPVSNWGGRKITNWGDMGGTVNGVVTPGGWATDPNYWKKLDTIWTSLLSYASAHGGTAGAVGAATASAPASRSAKAKPTGKPGKTSAPTSATPNASPSATPSSSASSSSSSNPVCQAENAAVSGSAQAVVDWAVHGDGLPYDQCRPGCADITGPHDCFKSGFKESCRLAAEDCSGFTKWVMWNALGVDIGGNTSEQLGKAEKAGEVLFESSNIQKDVGKLKVGDLIFFGSASGAAATDHVAVYVGKGVVNEASTYGQPSGTRKLYNFLSVMTVVRLKQIATA